MVWFFGRFIRECYRNPLLGNLIQWVSGKILWNHTVNKKLQNIWFWYVSCCTKLWVLILVCVCVWVLILMWGSKPLNSCSQNASIEIFQLIMAWFMIFHKSTLCVHAKLLQLCLTLCSPMVCSPPGSSVHGILQARTLQWVALSSSRGSSPLRDQTQVLMSPALTGGFLTTSTTWEAHFDLIDSEKAKCVQ